VYNDKGDFDRAIADYEYALHLEPNHAGAKAMLQTAREERER
jgi:hypothetical protein